MHGFSEHQLLGAFLAIAVMLLVTRGMANLSRRWDQPEVLGELLGGFLIGPSVLGALAPTAYTTLFLNSEVSLSLTLLSWLGAILLLMIAGMEADLTILREKAFPGSLAAIGAIGASLVTGTLLGVKVFGRGASSSFFLGLVLSVTAVSVVAKLLIEREALRRDYAQVMLAAGIVGEVLVWPLIAVLSSVQHRANPFVAGLEAAVLALGFFAFMLTLGRRFTFWTMRLVADVMAIPNGELSLVLILLCVSAAATTLMGLHPLLGAFVFGLLLSKAPRATIALKERIQTVTIAFFAPIFFGLAGMRVNLFNLRGVQSLKEIAILLVVAGAIKILLGFLGALAGRLPVWEAATVGVGLNLKGGTDVVVAIVGTEMLLFPSDLYTTYAVVAILTVLITPPVMSWLADKTQPGPMELKRLNREEARKLAYLADRERVLLPLIPELLPAGSARVVAAIAAGKQQERELFDITELSFEEDTSLTRPTAADTVIHASSSLARAAEDEYIHLRRIYSDPSKQTGESRQTGAGNETGDSEQLPAIKSAAEGQHLLAMGAARVSGEVALSFGDLQDRILRETSTDVLVTVCADCTLQEIRRILVPINGLAHSLAAADVAAYIAKGTGAEVTLLTVMTPRLGTLFWRDRKHRDLLQAGYTITREAQTRIARLDIRQSEQVVLANDPAEAAVQEMRRRPYDLLVFGGVQRSSDQGISLGRTAERLLQVEEVPRVLLISRNAEITAA
jgi:Kef-type K+ transport system membrane component KefB/nucleotide-binding universal stress UspA family protein